MNIFALDDDPIKAAQYLCNKHIVKMLTESLQILSTVIRLKDEVERPYLYARENKHYLFGIYKPTHQNHPCTKWAAESVDNFEWLNHHTRQIIIEYRHRYGYDKFKDAPATFQNIQAYYHLISNLIGNYREHTPFVQCMPDIYKNQNSPIDAYRAYYKGDKARFAKWYSKVNPKTSLVKVPDWWS